MHLIQRVGTGVTVRLPAKVSFCLSMHSSRIALIGILCNLQFQCMFHARRYFASKVFSSAEEAVADIKDNSTMYVKSY